MTEPIRHTHPLLRRAELAADPIEQFGRWYELAESEVPLAEAMTLATVGADGGPDARMVLLKGHGADGFRFFTNLESAKAERDRRRRARRPGHLLARAGSPGQGEGNDRAARRG